MSILSTMAGEGTMAFGLEIAVKVTALLVLLLALDRLCRRQHSGWRHLIWRCAVIGILLLPVAAAILPELPVVVATGPVSPPVQALLEASQQVDRLARQPRQAVTGSAASEVTGAPAPTAPMARPPASRARETSWVSRMTWAEIGAVVYAVGVLVVLGQLLLGLSQTARLRRSSTPVDGLWLQELSRLQQASGIRRPVELRASEHVGVPSQLGVLRPVVLLPREMVGKAPDERGRAAIAHELVHVGRADYLFNLLAAVGLALYWCHPLVWLAVRRLRETGEQVCDDSVVELLGSFDGYAETLIGVVQGMQRRRTGLAVSMARSPHIESRVRRILRLAGGGSPRTGRVAAAVFTVAMAATAGLVATGTPRAEAQVSPPDEGELTWSAHTAMALPLDDITIDGDLDDWPESLPAYPIRYNSDAYGETDVTGVDLDASTDLSPSFRVGYSLDEQLIYVAVEVRDDHLYATQTDYMGTDAIEIYLSARSDLDPNYYVHSPPGGSYSAERPNPSLLVPGGDYVAPDGTRSRGAVHRDGDTTVYEWALEPIGRSLDDVVRLRPNMTLGLDVAVVDKDAADETTAWVAWTPTTSKFAGGDRIGRVVLAQSADDIGSVAIQVTDDRGEAFAEAWFEVWRDGVKVMAAKTDGAGTSSTNLPRGRYEIRVTHRGYRAAVSQHDIAGGDSVEERIVLEDLGTRFYVVDDAAGGGDGSAQRPFGSIAAALAVCSRGDTVQLAAGTYDQPLELIGHVTILGAGDERTLVTGEANWGLGLRPFITFYDQHGPELYSVKLPGVVMADFTLDGGDRYPSRSARDVSDLLAAANAVGNWRIFVGPGDVETLRGLLERRPELATTPIYSPDAPPTGTTLLHRIVRAYDDATDEDYEIAKLLIAHGADVNAVGGQAHNAGETALGYAGAYANARLVELFLEHDGDPGLIGPSRWSPVDVTAHEGAHNRDRPGYIPALEMLIEAGGEYDLGHLILLGHTERLLAELDRDPELIHETVMLRHEWPQAGTVLHGAADDCDAEIAELLLDRGVDIDALDNRGQTALQRAVTRARCRDVVALLLERGAGTDLIGPVILGDTERVAARHCAGPGHGR